MIEFEMDPFFHSLHYFFCAEFLVELLHLELTRQSIGCGDGLSNKLNQVHARMALVTVDLETAQPTRKLLPIAVEWCRSLGSDAKTVDDILTKPDVKVLAAIQDGIDRANNQVVSNASRVQRWTILPDDISLPGGELGPTLKIKWFYFNKKYAEAITKLYKF